MLVEDLTDEEKAAVYVYGTVQQLFDANILNHKNGLKVQFVTNEGISVYDQLTATGYKPTPTEIFEHLLISNLIDPAFFNAIFATIVIISRIGFYEFEEEYRKSQDVKHTEEVTGDESWDSGDIDYY